MDFAGGSRANRNMVHVTVRSAKGTLLFRNWQEAAGLWRRIVRSLPLECLALMPDHVHLLCAAIRAAALAAVMSGYARWRNHARAEAGPVWAPAAGP